MVNKEETLKILNKERDFEERLAKNLSLYFIDSLDYIEEISDEEKEKTKDTIHILLEETKEHESIFEKLINMVMENAENNY